MKQFFSFSLAFTILSLCIQFQNGYSQCASPITTIMNQNNGQDGNMFNVTAINDIFIDSVWCNFESGTVQEVEIWWRPGTFLGNANSATGWTMIDSVINLPSQGVNNYTHVPIFINLPVSAGNTVALYVTRAYLPNAGPYMRYTNGGGGTTAGQVYTTNADLSISYAYGKDYPFGTTNFNPRIWNGRLFYHCCPTPSKAQGPFNGPTSVCAGDTVVFWIPKDSNAQGYEWTVPTGDSILSTQGDTMITVAIGPFSTGGQICVDLEDSCTFSGDTCFSYTVAQPTAPSAILGPLNVCQGDSAWYSTASLPGIVDYEWFLTNGTVLAEQDSMIHIQFNVGTVELCLRVKDSCSWSDTTCILINASASPTAANAGPDRNVCDGNLAMLNATVPGVGVGTWTIYSGPGTGVFSDSSSNSSTFSGNAAGVYVLRWTVSSAGCPVTYDDMQVTVNMTPTADFFANDVCEGSPVGFIDLSQANGGVISSWNWDMNQDLVIDHINQNPIHFYGSPGTYNVRLIVGNQGCADTAFKSIIVSPLPDVSFSAEDVCFGLPAEFENNNTVQTGNITKTYWNYGDGSPIDSGNANFAPNHIYSQAGNYTVWCTAKTNKDCVATDQILVKVYHTPKAKFAVNNSCQFQTTSFVDQSTVSGAQISSWAWDFGDNSDSSFIRHPSHDYETNGFVSVSLQVWSSFGCYDDTVTYIEIFPTPVTEFNYQNKVCLGDTLNLESMSTIAYGTLVQHNWLVDDSIHYYSKNPSHYFDKIGLYKVRLQTISDKGCKSFIEKEVPVYEVPETEFLVENVCTRSEAQFRDTTKFGGAIALYEWDFGDSSPLVNEKNPIHVYDTHGVYNVNLYVESFKGCSSWVSHPIEVYERLIPRFTASPDSGCSPLNVHFIEKTKSESGVDWSRVWIFGDGEMQNDTGSHIYRNYTGKFIEYDVTLRVITEHACYSERTMDSLIYVVPQPLAAFIHSPEDLNTLSTVRPFIQFQNTSQEANKYRWSFGDETTSNEHNPAHEWEEAGEYEIVLVARNIYECNDTVSKSITISHVNVPYIPSAFTPNDDGNNEYFMVLGLEQIADMKMLIFDRWGNIVYEEDGVSAKWDGRNADRKIVQSGLYGYRVIYKTIFGEVLERNGVVTVLGVD